ncbi:MAG: prepilin-type N-terminal cleavage/methylation domain-containing protein [Gemmatimonadota bacterium]|nr:prepilin-type N-terminal cleavage/methylation domain-containing protein [Gemmatimonadota bacterium]
MLRHTIRDAVRDKKGFTLIELLIVVVIIGILAAIAIPQFASTKGKAFDATAKSDLRNLMSAQEAYYADNQTYGTLANLTTGNAFVPSPSVTVAVTANTAAAYEATATHSGSTKTYCVNTDQAATAPGKIVEGADC